MTVAPSRRWYQFSMRTVLVLVTFLCIGPGGYVAYQRQKARRHDVAVAQLSKLGGTQAYARPHWLRRLIEGTSAGYVVGLGLHSPQVTDAGLAPLPTLSELVWLNLNDTPITDAGLVHLTPLPRLKQLRLDETSISDAGLAHLAKLKALETLNLSRTKITDAGLPYLAGLANLKELELQKSQVTPAGVAELQKSLPNCTINR